MAYTTTQLIEAIKRRSFMPVGATTFSDTELLSIADEELKTTIISSILAIREEFFVFKQDFSITQSQAEYAIPARAIGMKVREVRIVDAAGNSKDLPLIPLEKVNSHAVGNPEAFYLKNNQVCLYPSPASTSNTLRVYYFLRPGELIATTDAAVISAIDTNTNTVSVGTIPSAWVTGDIFDFVKKDGAHEYVDIEYTSATVSGTDIIFSSLPSTLRVGDYICLAGYSPLVQLPPDYQPILAQAVAVQILENMNQAGAEKQAKRLAQMLDTAQKMINDRIEGEPETISHDWF